MAALERFLHDLPERTPVLLKAAMAHVQFETIHPFLDGNGRVGRLLIPLILCQEKVLREPLLYMSLYLKQHRDRYFELLSSVRLTGDWESWILFFAEGIREMADGAVATARKLEQVAVEDRARIAALGRVSGSALRIHQALQRRPLDSIPRLVRETRLSAPTAASALAALAQGRHRPGDHGAKAKPSLRLRALSGDPAGRDGAGVNVRRVLRDLETWEGFRETLRSIPKRNLATSRLGARQRVRYVSAKGSQFQSLPQAALPVTAPALATNQANCRGASCSR